MFGPADGGIRVQGVLTKLGASQFEWARQQLTALYLQVFSKAPSSVSDANTIEYLARGEKATRLYFEKKKRQDGT